jgi:hypothetical protein
MVKLQADCSLWLRGRTADLIWSDEIRQRRDSELFWVLQGVFEGSLFC